MEEKGIALNSDIKGKGIVDLRNQEAAIKRIKKLIADIYRKEDLVVHKLQNAPAVKE